MISFVFSMVLAASLPANPSENSVRLFLHGQQVENYDGVIHRLIRQLPTKNRPPDPRGPFLLFDDEPPIRVTQFLGNGGLTAVFLREDGRALRVPVASGQAYFVVEAGDLRGHHGPFVEGMMDFSSAMRTLHRVPDLAPFVHWEASRLPMFITVDFFDARANILDFYENRAYLFRSGVLSEADEQLLESELEVFARRVAHFEKIGDFKFLQVVTNGKIWRLLDASEAVRFAQNISDPTPFDHRNMGPSLPAQVYAWLNRVVRDERSKVLRTQTNCWELR